MWWKTLLKNRETREEMSFIDHLEELRWHVIRSLIAIVVGATVVFIYRNEIFDELILGPLHKDFISYQWMCELGKLLDATEYLCVENGVEMKLQSTEITGIFNTTIKLSLIGGLIVAFPYIIWEVWRFIKPALRQTETKTSIKFMVYISALFFMGVLFGYLVVAPFSINFLFNFNLGNLSTIEIKPTVSDYMENFTSTILGVALAFELPMVMYVLSKLTLVSARLLKKFRRYAYVVILFVAAVITPSPDWISQMIVAIPLVLLFELSIFVTQRVDNARMKEERTWR